MGLWGTHGGGTAGGGSHGGDPWVGPMGSVTESAFTRWTLLSLEGLAPDGLYWPPGGLA